MMKLALTLSLTAIGATTLAQGIVRFANNASTLISYGGFPPDPPVGPIQPFGTAVYYFALLTAPVGTTDPLAFEFAGIHATNTSALAGGRIQGGSLLGAVVPGWPTGESRAFEVVGWSANLGPVWNPSWLATRPTGLGQYFGLSAIGQGAAGPVPNSDPAPVPFPLFGLAPAINTGFVLTAVPEPTTTVLAALGAVAMMMLRRRR